MTLTRMEKLTDRIRWAMKARGLNQKTLALRVRVNVNTVTRWMNREYVPKTEVLFNIAKALNVSMDWLVDDDAPDDPSLYRTVVLSTKERQILRVIQQGNYSLDDVLDKLGGPLPGDVSEEREHA